jgi:hypothetical protein
MKKTLPELKAGERRATVEEHMEVYAAQHAGAETVEAEPPATPPHTAADAAAATSGGYRAGAFLSADAVSVKLIGYGMYVGKEMHPTLGFPNPLIKLDDGKHVWGCECWWAPEEDIREMVADYEAKGAAIIPIDIDAARKEWASSVA